MIDWTVSREGLGDCRRRISSRSWFLSDSSSCDEIPGREESVESIFTAEDGADSASKRAWRTAESLEDRQGCVGWTSVAEDMAVFGAFVRDFLDDAVDLILKCI